MKKEDARKRFEEIIESRKHKIHRVNKMMDMQFEDYDEETQELWVSIQVEDWMLNPGDVMHGGIISTAFDIAMGMHTLVLERVKTIVTTNLNIHFIRQIPPKSKLLIRSKVNRNGRTLANLYAEAYVEEKIAATALCEFMKLEETRTESHLLI